MYVHGVSEMQVQTTPRCREGQKKYFFANDKKSDNSVDFEILKLNGLSSLERSLHFCVSKFSCLLHLKATCLVVISRLAL